MSLALAAPARPQSGGGFDVSRSTIDGGGGRSTGASFVMVSTIGQPAAAGPIHGGVFSLTGGFWPGVSSPTATPTQIAPATPTLGATPTVAPTATTRAVTPTPTRTATATKTTTPTLPVILTPTVTATPGSASVSVRKCRAAIAKSSGAFVRAQIEALKQCRKITLKGKFTGVCRNDAKVSDKFAKARRHLKATIAKACGGKNKICSGTDTGADTDELRTSIGFPAFCPGFEGNCVGAIADHDCGDIASCLECIDEAAVDQAIGLYYDVTPADPKAAKVLNACQQAIGTSAVKFFVAKLTALQSCWEQVNRGKLLGPCPDAAKAQPAIARAASRRDAAIAKACCGKNKSCNVMDGGADADFDPATEIRFRTTCVAVTVPGGASCDGAITDVQSLIGCVDCVTDFKVDCIDAAQVTQSVVPYPVECE